MGVGCWKRRGLRRASAHDAQRSGGARCAEYCRQPNNKPQTHLRLVPRRRNSRSCARSTCRLQRAVRHLCRTSHGGQIHRLLATIVPTPHLSVVALWHFPARVIRVIASEPVVRLHLLQRKDVRRSKVSRKMYITEVASNDSNSAE